MFAVIVKHDGENFYGDMHGKCGRKIGLLWHNFFFAARFKSGTDTFKEQLNIVYWTTEWEEVSP